MSTAIPKIITPEEAVFNTGTARKDVLENFDTLLALMDGEREAIDAFNPIRTKMDRLQESAKVRELKDPKKVVAKSSATGSAKRTGMELKKHGAPQFALVIAICYAVCRATQMVPTDFLFFIGGLINFVGLFFGLVAYWPLFIPGKVLDILTPFTMGGFYETIRGPVSSYVTYYIGSIAVVVVGMFLYRLIRGKKIASDINRGYKKSKAAYERDKDDFPRKEQERVAKVQQEIEAFRPEYEAAKARREAYEDAVKRWRQGLGISSEYRWKQFVEAMQSYVACMRADTGSEALEVLRQEEAWDRELGELSHQLDDKKIIREGAQALQMVKLMEQGASAAAAEQALNEARSQAAKAARDAHNAALVEDYKWHEMVGDIDDMESYGLLKLLDWEL